MKRKKASIITKLLVFALVLYAAVTLVSLRSKIATQQDAQTELQQQVKDMEVQNAKLQYAIDNKDDENVVSGIVRDELGLVGSGEKVFYDSEG